MKTGSFDFRPAKLLVRRFLRDDSGATVIEYGLIAAILSIVIIAGLGAIGGTMSSMFVTVGTTLGAVLGG